MNDETRSMLNELADFLDELPADRFDYSEWVGEDWEGDPGLSCGTVACAAGWATTLESYQNKGLRLTLFSVEVPDESAECWGNRRTGIDAMAKVLNISYEDAALLFLPSRAYRGLVAPGGQAVPSQVAAHIRRWIEVVNNRAALEIPVELG